MKKKQRPPKKSIDFKKERRLNHPIQAILFRNGLRPGKSVKLIMDSIQIGAYLIQRVTESNIKPFKIVREAVGVPPKSWSQLETEKWSSWLIQNQTGEPIGMINIVACHNKEREIGFVLIPSERAKGVLGIILKPFVLKLSTPFYAETAEDNLPARRVLEKAGFHQCEALHRTHIEPSGREVVTAAYQFLPQI